MNLQVELEDVSPVQKRLTISVDAREAAEEYQRIVKQFRGMAAVPGFRRGRAPAGLVKRRYKEEIEGELFQKLVPKAYKQAVEDEGLKPLTDPDLGELAYREGEPLTFTARMEVRPHFELPDYKGLEVEAPPLEVSQGEVDEELEKMRENMASLVQVEGRGVEQGDYATVVLKGWHLEEGQGRPAEEAEPDIHDESVVVQVGDERTHQAFTRALVGLREGDEESFVVEYEPDYADQNLAGKRVAYEILLTEIKEKQLPDLNDDFVKDLDIEGVEDLEQLRALVRERLEERKEAEREEAIRQALARQLIDRTSFEVPEALLADRVDQKIRQVAYNMMDQGVDPRTVQVDWARVRQDMRPEAENDVRVSLIVSEIARAEEIQVADEELEEELSRMAERSQQPLEKVRQQMRKEGSLEGLRDRLAHRKAMELIQENARITEKN